MSEGIILLTTWALEFVICIEGGYREHQYPGKIFCGTGHIVSITSAHIPKARSQSHALTVRLENLDQLCMQQQETLSLVKRYLISICQQVYKKRTLSTL